MLAQYLCVGVLLLVCLTSFGAEERPRPNILVILSDDAGFNEFSLHGAKRFPTPRIDSIAAGGVHCKTAYTSGAVCSPTRAGLLTGRYQNRFGHEFNIPAAMSETNGLPLTERTIADELKTAGYRTIALGKWHLGYAPKFHPLERGFTDYYGFLQGSRSYFPLAKPTPLNQLLRDREPVAEKFEYMTDELARAAKEYIAATPKNQPFFMYLAFNATHSPNDALPADLEKIPDDGGNRKVQAMSLALDRAVGVVLDELDKQKLRDNTLVIFLNDNGGAGGRDNTPLRGFKGSLFEGGVRVPFALQWPGVLPKGAVYSQPVISLDILPTALAAAGVKRTGETPMDGVDLTPYLTGKNAARPHPTLFWKNGRAWAVRDGDLKLARGLANEEKVELFDLSADECEANNLSDSRPEEVKRLTAVYNGWKKELPPPLWRSQLAVEK